MCVQGAEEPVAARITREDATGAVATVRGRCEADDPEAGPWISEAGHGPAPVFLVDVGSALATSDLQAIPAQPRAEAASHDIALDARDRITVGDGIATRGARRHGPDNSTFQVKRESACC